MTDLYLAAVIIPAIHYLLQSRLWVVSAFCTLRHAGIVPSSLAQISSSTAILFALGSRILFSTLETEADVLQALSFFLLCELGWGLFITKNTCKGFGFPVSEQLLLVHGCAALIAKSTRMGVSHLVHVIVQQYPHLLFEITAATTTTTTTADNNDASSSSPPTVIIGVNGEDNILSMFDIVKTVLRTILGVNSSNHKISTTTSRSQHQEVKEKESILTSLATISTIVTVLLAGTVFIFILLLPLLNQAWKCKQQRQLLRSTTTTNTTVVATTTNARTNITKTSLYFYSVCFLVIGCIEYPSLYNYFVSKLGTLSFKSQTALREPFSWVTWNIVFANQWTVGFLVHWIVCVSLAIAFLLFTTPVKNSPSSSSSSSSSSFSLQSRLRKLAFRKVFHVLAAFMFAPAIIVGVLGVQQQQQSLLAVLGFLTIGLVVGVKVLVLMEFGRAIACSHNDNNDNDCAHESRQASYDNTDHVMGRPVSSLSSSVSLLYPQSLWKAVDISMRRYADERDDAGLFITSHIYLLLGCALPIWLTIEYIVVVAVNYNGSFATISFFSPLFDIFSFTSNRLQQQQSQPSQIASLSSSAAASSSSSSMDYAVFCILSCISGVASVAVGDGLAAVVGIALSSYDKAHEWGITLQNMSVWILGEDEDEEEEEVGKKEGEEKEKEAEEEEVHRKLDGKQRLEAAATTTPAVQPKPISAMTWAGATKTVEGTTAFAFGFFLVALLSVLVVVVGMVGKEKTTTMNMSVRTTTTFERSGEGIFSFFFSPITVLKLFGIACAGSFGETFFAGNSDNILVPMLCWVLTVLAFAPIS